ncbi:MAG: VacJ family lipoprotein [Deltaproteobacteria bacterium]|nr:VacJ family lipoprotein [Deltaproteobacteria bacterium]
MKPYQTKYLLLALMFFTVLSTGCSLRRTAPSQTAPPSRIQRPASQAKELKAAPVSSGPVAKDDAAAAPVSSDPIAKDEAAAYDFDNAFEEFDDEFDFDADRQLVADPFAPVNKLMFHFNDKLYFWFLKPVARGYRFIVPGVIRTGVANFFFNITTPARFVNCLLQGKGETASFELGSFMLNSSVGILGFMNLTKEQRAQMPGGEDLGQTLGSYRIGNGFYIMWPLLGPSTLRDTVGIVGDAFLNPIRYIDPAEIGWAMTGYEFLNDVSFHIGDYETFKDAAIDPYEAFKDAYLQSRINKVNN